MLKQTNSGNGHVRWAWGLVAVVILVTPTALAQPVGAGLYKDEAIAEVEAVEAEAELEEKYVIEFGDEKDWVKLKSGEWLSGNLERMRDGSLEFDSASHSAT